MYGLEIRHVRLWYTVNHVYSRMRSVQAGSPQRVYQASYATMKGVGSRVEHVRLRNVVEYLEEHPEHAERFSKYFPRHIHTLRTKKFKIPPECNESQTPVDLKTTSTQTSPDHETGIESMEGEPESFVLGNSTASMAWPSIHCLDSRIQAEIIKVRFVFRKLQQYVRGSMLDLCLFSLINIIISLPVSLSVPCRAVCVCRRTSAIRPPSNPFSWVEKAQHGLRQ